MSDVWKGFALGLAVAWAFASLEVGAGVGFLAGSLLTILGLAWTGRKQASPPDLPAATTGAGGSGGEGP